MEVATKENTTTNPSAGAMVAKRLGFPTAAALVKTLRESVFTVNTRRGETPFTDHEVAAALAVANEYRLNPITRELYLTKSHGKLLVIVPIDGWVKVVKSHDTYDGVEFEWENDPETGKPISCTCIIYDKAQSRPTRVPEYYDECYQPGKEPWDKWPRRMLRHKAYIQCARLAYGLSGIMDPDEADRMRELEPEEYQVTRGHDLDLKAAVSKALRKPETKPEEEPDPWSPRDRRVPEGRSFDGTCSPAQDEYAGAKKAPSDEVADSAMQAMAAEAMAQGKPWPVKVSEPEPEPKPRRRRHTKDLWDEVETICAAQKVEPPPEDSAAEVLQRFVRDALAGVQEEKADDASDDGDGQILPHDRVTECVEGPKGVYKVTITLADGTEMPYRVIGENEEQAQSKAWTLFRQAAE